MPADDIMSTGELLTRWTVRLSLACYALTLLEELRGLKTPRAVHGARWLWTLGCGWMLVHIACAFQFFHHWSTAQAFADTAQKTERLMGMNFGAGIYLNYALSLLWIGDVAWWWSEPHMLPPRPAWVHWSLHAFFAFMIFNATVVFEHGATRWISLSVALALGGIWLRQRLWKTFRFPNL